ncbi:hypothetical protein [Candidatus Contendibacter odensensis]|uniref:TVP38/TMEM64 family membrane protein n=1 Tax=Candidatus Contendobacter odensis Run_B_J11 TaxID=1400861 RepID=A0A7U7GB12_9GAMM|nr:hypothetical protein [Candidatus Contendobacter odensis]CDH44453.1 membrane hypothetical protein [Candidatus Contendobacter odensis Run_B_J11]
MNLNRFSILLLLAGLIATFFALDLGRFFNLDTLKAQQAMLAIYQAEQPVLTVLLFFTGYVVITRLSVPGAMFLTLVAGAIFGLGWGTVLVFFASTLGATLAFLAARLVLRDALPAKSYPAASSLPAPSRR